MTSTLITRPSPQGKPVSLFVTCLVDLIFPDTGMSALRLLEHLGCVVDFPQGQTCCGQPAFNGGYWKDAKEIARQFLMSGVKASRQPWKAGWRNNV